MTALPAANYISNSARTQGEGKQALEDIVSFLRERGGNGGGWTSLASAGTTNLAGQTSRMILVTGTTTITSFGTSAQADNIPFKVRFAAALTLTHSSTLILPGAANITTAAGDIAEVVWEGSNVWRVTDYQRASGLPVVNPTVATPVLTKSYDSGDQTITLSGGLTLAHSMSAVPKIVMFYFVCRSAELGYSAGDEVIVAPLMNALGASNVGFASWADSTNVNVRFSGNASGIPNKTTGVSASMTPGNWRLIVRAYA